MYEKASILLEKSIDMFFSEDTSDYPEIMELEDQVDHMKNRFQDHHVRRLSQGTCSVEIGLIFTDTIIGLERIGDHAVNIAASVMPDGFEED